MYSLVFLTVAKSAKGIASSPCHSAQPVANYFKESMKFSKIEFFDIVLFIFHIEMEKGKYLE
jgi:hypothetical protein